MLYALPAVHAAVYREIDFDSRALRLVVSLMPRRDMGQMTKCIVDVW
jgi:hypothetical protein